jgi:hypothetical protein
MKFGAIDHFSSINRNEHDTGKAIRPTAVDQQSTSTVNVAENSRL